MLNSRNTTFDNISYKKASDLITLDEVLVKLKNRLKRPLSEGESDLLLKLEWLYSFQLNGTQKDDIQSL